MPSANLSCYRVGCSGEFQYLGDASGDTLYRCAECDARLRQTAAEEVAEGDGVAADLAEVLLEGGPK